MAASVSLAGSTYTYTVSNIQNALTLTPSNRTSRYGAVYGKPTITRQKSGSANTRYFILTFLVSNQARETGYYHAAYSATFTKTGTTATVAEINAGSRPALSSIAKEVTLFQTSSISGRVVVEASDSSSLSYASVFASKEVSASYAMSGWTPSTPSISYSLSQSETGDPDPTIFGYIAGYAKASWSGSGHPGNWSPVIPYGTLTLSANGASDLVSGQNATLTRSLSAKLLTAASTTGTVKIANTIGGSATATSTVTVQPYSKPIVNGLALGRTTVNNEPHATMSVGWAVDILNKESTASGDIQSGAITATWEAEDLSDQGTVFASGSFDIISDGSSMTGITGTTPIETLVDTSGNNHNVYNTDNSFKFTVYITDRIGERSASITAILNSDFYIICVREGGRGIGFGKVPPTDAFYVDMDAYFKELTRSGSGTQADPYVYSGGINDEALLDADTIQAIENLLSS